MLPAEHRDLAQPRRAGAEHVDEREPERERLPPALIVAARCDRCRPLSLDDVRALFEREPTTRYATVME